MVPGPSCSARHTQSENRKLGVELIGHDREGIAGVSKKNSKIINGAEQIERYRRALDLAEDMSPVHRHYRDDLREPSSPGCSTGVAPAKTV